PRSGRRGEHFSKRLGAAIILVWGYDKTALGEICSFLDVLEAGKHRGLIRAVILAGVNLADWNASLTQSSPKLLRQHLALVIEIPLGRDVVEIERMGGGLIREGSAMPDNDNKTASTKGLRDLLVACRDSRSYDYRYETSQNRQDRQAPQK